MTDETVTKTRWSFRDPTTGCFFYQEEQAASGNYYWNPNADPRLSAEIRSSIDAGWLQDQQTPEIFLQSQQHRTAAEEEVHAHEQPHIIMQDNFSVYYRSQEQQEHQQQNFNFYSVDGAGSVGDYTETLVYEMVGDQQQQQESPYQPRYTGDAMADYAYRAYFEEDDDVPVMEEEVSVYVKNFPRDYTYEYVYWLVSGFQPSMVELIRERSSGKFGGRARIYFADRQSALNAALYLNRVDTSTLPPPTTAYSSAQPRVRICAKLNNADYRRHR